MPSLISFLHYRTLILFGVAMPSALQLGVAMSPGSSNEIQAEVLCANSEKAPEKEELSFCTTSPTPCFLLLSVSKAYVVAKFDSYGARRVP